MSGIYSSSPSAQRLLQTGTTAIKNPVNWGKLANLPLSTLLMTLSPTTANADEVEWEKQLMMNRRANQKGINQVGMQRKIQEAQAQNAANQVRQNIQTYGNRDRPNTGINRPGGGYGQSPTGGDVAGTPFSRGGIIGAF